MQFEDVERELERLLIELGEGRAIDWDAVEERSPRHAAELRRRIAALRGRGLLPESTPHKTPETDWTFESRYSLEFELGRGGMGVVSRVYDRQLGRAVALKRLFAYQYGVTGSRATDRFLAEARVMAQLEHPHIVPILDVGQASDGSPYFTMKIVPGGSLKERMRAWQAGAEEPPPLATRVRYVVAAARAVHSAHERGVLHRDLKPSNLLLGAFDQLLVSDWGLATLDVDGAQPAPHPGPSSPDLTATGELIGTPSYMAPEQARGEETSVATDVWGLGAILHQLLTGLPPFTARAMSEILEKARAGVLDEKALRRSDVPAPLVAICTKALSARQEGRYSTADRLADDLEAFLMGEPGSAWRDSTAVRTARWVRRHPARATWALLFIVGLAAVREIHASRVALAEAHLPGVVSQDLQGWVEQRDAWNFANDTASLNEWWRSYVASSDAFLETHVTQSSLDRLRNVDPVLARTVLDELYLHAFAMFKGAAVAVWQLSQGLATPTQSHQGDVGRWNQLLEEIPGSADVWPRIKERIDALEDDPDVLLAWNAVVRYMEDGDVPANFEDSESWSSPSAAVLRGRLLGEMRRIEDAVEWLDDAIRRHPEYAPLRGAWIESARALSGEEIEGKKRRHLAAWVALQPDRTWAKGAYAAKLIASGVRAEGVEWLREAMSADARIAAPVARSLFGSDPSLAIELVTEAVERLDRDAYATSTLAEFLEQSGRIEEAVEHRRNVAAWTGEHAAYSYLAMGLCALAGYPEPPRGARERAWLEEAERAWAAAVTPMLFRAKQDLGLVRLVLGRFEEGLEVLRESLEARLDDMGREVPILAPDKHRARVAKLLGDPLLSLVDSPNTRAARSDLVEEVLELARDLVDDAGR